MALIDNLISYYKYDVDADDTEGTNDGVVSGATLTTGDGGIIDEAYDFDGSNDSIDSGRLIGLESQSAVTYSFWMYQTVVGGVDVMLSKSQDISAGTEQMQIFSFSDNKLYIEPAEAANRGTYVYNGDVTAETWAHIVVVFDGGLSGNANRLKLYIDGDQKTLVFSGTIPALTTSSTHNLFVGMNEDSDRFYDGRIDELGFWARALSASEVSELYNGGAGLAYPFEADSLAMISPNGGELVDAVSVHEITWSDTGTIVNVKLEYSLNNGGDYTTITASTTNDNSFNWDVPNVRSAQALIRISDASDGDPVDVSDAVFTILEAKDADRPNTTKGTKEVATRYPVTSGLVKDTTSQVGRQMNLVPERGSIVPRRKKVGF